MRVDLQQLKSELLEGARFLDVRAPVEFLEGHIPGAVNIPLLEDSERHEVGTTYKSEGKDAAIRLGNQLVSGQKKEMRIAKWREFFQSHPNAVLYCFRGGLRSQTVQSWLKDVGVQMRLLEGGYKAARNFFLSYLDEVSDGLNCLLISGPTGSGKTRLIQKARDFYPAVDLEFLAKHKGSAFGFETVPQPAQALFENQLSVQLLRILSGDGRPLLLEDESRLIGRCVVPEKLFSRMRESRVVWIDEPMDVRVQNIFEDYILNTVIAKGSESEARALFDRYEQSLIAISRKLGGARTQEIRADLSEARKAFDKNDLEPNRVWIKKLLIYYYDPLYLGSLEKRKPFVKFKGTEKETLSFLRELRADEI